VQVKHIDCRGPCRARAVCGIVDPRYSVMRGYWKTAERTRDVIDAGGWMHPAASASSTTMVIATSSARVKE